MENEKLCTIRDQVWLVRVFICFQVKKKSLFCRFGFITFKFYNKRTFYTYLEVQGVTKYYKIMYFIHSKSYKSITVYTKCLCINNWIYSMVMHWKMLLNII